MSRDKDQPEVRRRIACSLVLVVIVAWAFVARSGALAGPFGFGWQFLGAFYSKMARNLVEYGPVRARFAMIENAAPATPDQWIVYSHHPPGMAIATAALMTWLGDGPLPIRSLGVAFALLQVVVTYALVAEALSRRAGLAAAFATAVLPAGAYFSTHGSELGPEAIALALLALLLDERARARDPARPRRALVLAALAGSVFFAWPGLIVAGFIALRDLFGRRFGRALTFGAAIPVAFGLHATHMFVAQAFATPAGVVARPTTFSSLFAHSFLGVTNGLPDITPAQIEARLIGHVRFLFGWPALGVALFGATVGLAAARWWAPERSVARRAWTTLAGLATFAILYSAPLLQAVVIHRYWLIVALPLVAFLIGAAVHATAVRPIACGVWAAAAVAGGAWVTRDVMELQRRDRTPYYQELGDILRKHVPADQVVYTTANDTECTSYYARREVRGGFDELHLGRFLHAGGSIDAPMKGWFALIEPTVDPSDTSHAKLAEFLERSWTSTRCRLEKTGADVVLFDLSRRSGR
jgi:hypothetical protein